MLWQLIGEATSSSDAPPLLAGKEARGSVAGNRTTAGFELFSLHKSWTIIDMILTGMI